MTKLNEFMKNRLFENFIVHTGEYDHDVAQEYANMLNDYFRNANVSKYLCAGFTATCKFPIFITSPSLHDSIHKIVLVVVPDREGLVIEQVNYQAIDEEDCWLLDEWRSNEFNSLRA